MTRGDIPCHLFKKTFQSSTSPPDSPLFFPCAPQNLPPPPVSASPVIRSSIFLPFSPFLSRPAGESPPIRRGPVLISLFAASGGRIPHRPDVGLPLSPFLPHPAGTSSGQNAALRQSSLRPPPEKTDITKTGSPQAPGSFRFCPNPVIPRGEAPGIRTTARRPPPKCAPPVRAPPCAAAGSAAPSTPCAPPPPPK
jgi:hypothetical protein